MSRYIVARRHIDPTNADRMARIVRQHGLNMRDEAPLPRVMPMSKREIVKLLFVAGLFVFALLGVMAVAA